MTTPIGPTTGPAGASPITGPAGASPITGTAGAASADTSRLKSKDNLKAAGEKFETVFTGMMLKSMRQAKLADPLFDSKAIDTFSDMQDAQITKSMAQNTPLGIGKAMTDFLAKSQPDLNQGSAKPSK